MSNKEAADKQVQNEKQLLITKKEAAERQTKIE